MIKEDIAGYAGKVIRDIRNAREVTLMELADYAKISYQQLQKYELGQNRISVDRLYKIAKYLEADVTEFFPSYALSKLQVDPQVLKASRALTEIKDLELKGIVMKLLNKLSTPVEAN